jgi:hypothetical protein
MSSLNTEFVIIKYDIKGNKQWSTKYNAGKGHQWWQSALIMGVDNSIYLKGFILDRDMKNEKSEEEEESMRVGVIIKYDDKGKEQGVQRFYNIQEQAKLLSAIPIKPVNNN